MNEDEKFNLFQLRLKQFVLGPICGFLGMFIFAAAVPPTDLFIDVLYSLIAGLVTMIAAVMIIGYLHSKKEKNK